MPTVTSPNPSARSSPSRHFPPSPAPRRRFPLPPRRRRFLLPPRCGSRCLRSASSCPILTTLRRHQYFADQCLCHCDPKPATLDACAASAQGLGAAVRAAGTLNPYRLLLQLAMPQVQQRFKVRC
ncbi:hypothetical protein BS78_09G152300 [Paspalum vaginatum]|nr:hypothetical protein BS78_09G152300 [Paspalum vaginatum]